MEKKKGNLGKRILISLGVVAAAVVVLLIVHVVENQARDTKQFEDLITKKMRANVTSDVDEYWGWSSESDDVDGGIAFISRNGEEATKMYDKIFGRSEFLNGEVEEVIIFEKDAPVNTQAYVIRFYAITFTDKADADEYYKERTAKDDKDFKHGFIRYKYSIRYNSIGFASFFMDNEDGTYQLGKQVINVSCLHAEDDERAKADDIFTDLRLVKPRK